MKIEQLEQLIKIVESGSMNIAAREMYVARSSLSTSMKHLEAELGAIVGPNNPLYKLDRDEIELQELSSFTHLENYATPTDHAWEHRVLSEDGYRGRYVVSDLGLALRLVSETDAIMIDARDDEIYRGFYAKSDYRFLHGRQANFVHTLSLLSGGSAVHLSARHFSCTGAKSTLHASRVFLFRRSAGCFYVAAKRFPPPSGRESWFILQIPPAGSLPQRRNR